MLRFVQACFIIAVSIDTAHADQRAPQIRRITEAASVLAVYGEDHRLGSAGTPAIIFAAWPDGHVVWSGAPVHGGSPYRQGNVNPEKIAKLFARFERDGLFASKRLNQGNFGPDSQFTTLLIKSGTKQIKMQSWHETFEESEKLVVTSTGASALDGRQRLDVLYQEPADYLYFRLVWSETRVRLLELLPSESSACLGRPIHEAGVLSWQEPPNKP